MHLIITIVQIILALLLIGGVLIQQRGSGLSASLGGDGSSYSTRRGAEKVIFVGTIVVSILFFIVSVARILI